jgi:hypothetical protein
VLGHLPAVLALHRPEAQPDSVPLEPTPPSAQSEGRGVGPTLCCQVLWLPFDLLHLCALAPTRHFGLLLLAHVGQHTSYKCGCSIKLAGVVVLGGIFAGSFPGVAEARCRHHHHRGCGGAVTLAPARGPATCSSGYCDVLLKAPVLFYAPETLSFQELEEAIFSTNFGLSGPQD